MRRSFSILLAVSAVAAFAAPAVAQDASSSATPRAVFVCASDAATSRSFQQQYGVRPTFVSATEARAAAANGERWDTPRCMTEREHRRLTDQARVPRVPA